MSEQFPFSYRVILLLGLMAVAATVDYWRRGREAARYREYSFICITGMLGGLVGFANDCVTSTISPDYFILGKGLEDGAGLRWRAGVYGFKAGLSAGAIGGAISLFVRGRKSRFSMEQMRGLLRSLWMPVAGAIFLAFVFPIVAGGLDPAGLSGHLGSLLDTGQIARFRKVWWIHVGLYTGLIIGLAAMILSRKSDVAHPE